MAALFERMRYHAAEQPEVGPQIGGAPRPLRGVAGPAGETGLDFHSDEAAARFHLDRLMAADARPTVRGMRAEEAATRTPDLVLKSEMETPLNTRFVAFTQTHATIPVFGSKAIVEMSEDRELLAADAHIGDIGEINSNASLSPAEAIAKVADATGSHTDPARLAPPEIMLFRDPADDSRAARWHLAWVVRNYPAAPAGEQLAERHGRAASMRTMHPQYDFIVDAHTGEILYSYSATPTMMPVRLVGIDEADMPQQVWGAQVDDGFALTDPLFDLITYDLALGDIDQVAFPSEPVVNADADLSDTHRAAITAHVNARRVKEFYNTVLGRDSVDGKGMDLVSVVNCTLSRPGRPRSDEWENAVWWQNKMWYGQTREGERLVSLARYLDIIAHELTHGVTETTSDLVYRDQSGALNESFSDIFGIIIKNWFTVANRNDVTTWNWELGAGWNDGAPLRDLSDPTRTGDPAHMDDYDPDPLNRDHGGVHTNSNIHNKAAFLILTATDDAGDPTFTVEEASVAFYMALNRLAPMATFSECRDAMVDSVRTMFIGDPPVRDHRVGLVEAAYAAVGIE